MALVCLRDFHPKNLLPQVSLSLTPATQLSSWNVILVLLLVEVSVSQLLVSAFRCLLAFTQAHYLGNTFYKLP